MVRKPEGVEETEQLLKVLARVPKKELDDQLAKTKAKALATADDWRSVWQARQDFLATVRRIVFEARRREAELQRDEKGDA